MTNYRVYFCRNKNKWRGLVYIDGFAEEIGFYLRREEAVKACLDYIAAL